MVSMCFGLSRVSRECAYRVSAGRSIAGGAVGSGTSGARTNGPDIGQDTEGMEVMERGVAYWPHQLTSLSSHAGTGLTR